MNEFSSMVTGLLKWFADHAFGEPLKSRGVLWTVLAWCLGLSLLVLLIHEPVFTVIVVLCNAVMNTIEPVKELKANPHYKSRRK